MASDISPDCLAAWNNLSPDEQKSFQQLISIVDKGSVTEEKESGQIKCQFKSTFVGLAPEYGNTVQTINPRKDKIEQVEAVLEMYARIRDQKLPRGLVLNKEKAAGAAGLQHKVQIPDGLECTASVLGKGNSAGEVIVVKDHKTEEEMALKTIMISQFKKDEVLLWIHLGDAKVAPELYSFELKDNKIFFSMEIMTGKNLQDVMDDMTMARMQSKDPDLARSFSLCVLHQLLQIQEKMWKEKFSHGDIHGGNIQLDHSMDVKLFDFGRAKKLLTDQDKKTLVKNDVVNLIRVFCCLYSGYDFNDSFEALEILTARRLNELNVYMLRIPVEQRKEMYMIMNELFETVRDWHKEGYGDTTGVAEHVNSLLDGDMKEIKEKAAVIIFPDKFQHPMKRDDVDSSFRFECQADVIVGDDDDPIWDDVDMIGFTDNVTEENLRELGVVLKQ